MRIGIVLLIGIIGVSILWNITGSISPKKTFEEISEECDEKMFEYYKDIQMDLMYHCNNNTCISYGLSHYKLQCIYNLQKN
jgi:hypothetical protein